MNNNCMNVLRFLTLIVGFYLALCISMKHFLSFPIAHAQSVIQQATQIGNNITPNTNIAVPNLPVSLPTTPPTLNPSATVLSGDLTKIKKYYEFKSICTRNVENAALIPAAIKEKRLKLITDKLDAVKKQNIKEIIVQVKLLLVREYLKQKLTSKAEELFKRDGLSFLISDQATLSAEIDIQKNLIRQAKTNLNKHLETYPKDINALEKLAEVYNLLNNYTEAKIVYDDLAKMNSKKSYAEEFCQNAAYNAEHENTRIYCGRLQKFDPKSTVANIYMGISLRDQELYSDAIKQFEKSLAIKKTEFAATCLGEAFFLHKSYDKSIEAYNTSITIKPESPRAYLGLASAYIKKNQYKEALEQFKQSCRLGLQPLTEMTDVANTLRDQKSDLTNIYFDAVTVCKNNTIQ